MSSFGTRFGLLVRERRGLEGWTQEDLASRAFGDSTRKSRISDLESGKIANPQQKTVDALTVALNIGPEEIAACRHPPATEARPVILENLALRFGAENPDAPPEALEEFLREKAKDYAEMQARLSALAEAEGRIANLVGAAQAALEAGDFDEADERLKNAEEMQQAEHTLVQVRKQAAIRVQRGDALLLKDDAEGAAAHYEAAAAMFDAFDASEGAEARYGVCERLYRHALRFGGPGFLLSAGLLRRALAVWTRQAHPVNWATTQNTLAVALSDQAARTEGAAGAALLAEAVAAYRAALEVYTREAHPVGWATTQNNLANALSNQAARTEGAAGAALLAEAVAAWRAALEVYTREAHPVNWAVTQFNLALALEDMAERTPATARNRLQEALAAVTAAREVHDPAHFPREGGMAEALTARIAAKLDALD